jgi:hypothetical protein
MSWKREIPIIVRTLINDLGPDYTYPDNRIVQVSVVAAQYVQFDVNLDQKYTINIVSPNITPDPTIDPKDEIFISLTALKAACIIDQSAFRTKAALEGIRAALGPASLSVSNNNLSGYKTLLEQGPCALYRELTEHWDVANATAIRAIFSPFVGNNFDPQNLNNPGHDYTRLEDNQFF